MESKKERGQFYCEVCDCELKDSANYRDHINGKRHNRNKGINLKQFKDSTLEEVKAMLEKKRQERIQKMSSNEKALDMIKDVPGERDNEDDYDDNDYNDDEEDYDEEDE